MAIVSHLLRKIERKLKIEVISLYGNLCLTLTDTNALAIYLNKRVLSQNQIFALDLHTSVTRDVSASLLRSKFRLRRWSISSSSYLYREPNLKLQHINSENWRDLDTSQVKSFNKKYRAFLDSNDAYLVSYTFSFLQIFATYRKPILAINATRYESPYTYSELEFHRLNTLIKDMTKKNLLTIVSNNLGDRDYLRFFTGVDSRYVPSLCEYIPRMIGSSGKWVVMSRNIDLAKKISLAGKNLVSQHEIYPNGYTHEEFALNVGVIYIPYNISTMRFFELATAGFQIRIPTDRLLMEWCHLPGVLSELSWVQVIGKPCPIWLAESPADPNWNQFYRWWLQRADWHNLANFENVKFFDSLEELDLASEPSDYEGVHRNHRIRQEWQDITDEFYRSANENKKKPNENIDKA